jgi:hypothetical protein
MDSNFWMFVVNTNTNISPFEILFTKRAKNQKNFLKKNVDFRAVIASKNVFFIYLRRGFTGRPRL